MSVLQITYNDVENILETASLAKPYLVYSYNLRKLPNQRSINKINGRFAMVCWVSKEERDSIALLILNEKDSLTLSEMCLNVRTNGGKVKFREIVYKNLQTVLENLNTLQKQENTKSEKQLSEELLNRFKSKELLYTMLRKKLLSTPLENHLERPVNKYKGFTDTGYIVDALGGLDPKKNPFKEDFSLVKNGENHYVVPYGFEFLVDANLDNYYDMFVEDESLLDSKLEKAISFTEKYNEFANLIDTFQNKEDLAKKETEESSKDYKLYLENEMTFFGRMKNRFSKK